jgi:hypothetical protein
MYVMHDKGCESTGPNYDGPERRRRKVYLTRNTEYHFLDEVCVAVRHKDSGQWRMAHVALQRRLSGCVHFTSDGEVHPKADPPVVGDALFFATDGADVITSALTAIGRPLPQTIESYPL